MRLVYKLKKKLIVDGMKKKNVEPVLIEIREVSSTLKNYLYPLAFFLRESFPPLIVL